MVAKRGDLINDARVRGGLARSRDSPARPSWSKGGPRGAHKVKLARRARAIGSHPFGDGKSAALLAQAIVDTVREPLLVLDRDLEVVTASRSFYVNFQVGDREVVGRSIFDLVDGRFDSVELRRRLAAIGAAPAMIEGFEIAASFPKIGKRTLILDAREVVAPEDGRGAILLALEDVTERRSIEAQKAALLKETTELLRQKDILLQEIQHRVANSLQIIASILMMKARLVISSETREHLEDAHRRVLSVATVQEHLLAAGRATTIEIRPYLMRLCESLAASMVGDDAAISISVHAGQETIPSADAVSLGLIVTELVINSLKYAFPTARPGAEVRVSYETLGSNWRLSVGDNGVGKPTPTEPPKRGGLGASLVAALAHQLGASVESVSDPDGLKVSITRATFDARSPAAA